MVQYDYLEENEGSELLKRINEMAREGWRVVGFSVKHSPAGMMRVTLCALVEREVPESREA